jgi:hypothetical protein|tara:strand:+ start:179 stop:430 length:252 start_codon:yes stop_codon:yes gene_type:complete
MGGLKKLTEQGYMELNSMKQKVFDVSRISDRGRLNLSRYEHLSARVNEMGEGYDVSIFVKFLDYHKGVYEMRKKEVSSFLQRA